MKVTITDANFPRTSDGRVYHLGLRHGDVANRIITVGDPSRARRIAQFLDASPQPFTLQSERGFLTITGKYNGTPVSIVAIGMGIANMDFFVREVRESVFGDMVVVRIGSCGALIESLPVGSYVVPKACVAITRNYDFDFTAPASTELESGLQPYHVSKAVSANMALHDALVSTMDQVRPEGSEGVAVAGNTVNAAADSFYASQGRITSFHDHNETLIDRLIQTVPDVATLEMETHHLFHLASVYPTSDIMRPSIDQSPMLTRGAGEFVASHQSTLAPPKAVTQRTGAIYASAVQMVFAQRQSQTFITPEEVIHREEWAGKAVLEALVQFELETVHPDEGSVWHEN